ncbi:MAG: AAA family ATPase, partial [Niameybacter sp.]
KKTPGIVLIDEIDLHLHPEWQRKVVGDFKRVFPEVQFVVTTHSPFIIQSLEEGELRNLDKLSHMNGSVDYTKMSIEDITEDVMGVEMPQWSQKKREMFEAAKKYYEALNDLKQSQNDDEITRLRETMDELTKPYADDIAYVAFLERKRAVAECRMQGGKQGEASR